jgi:hypothetical protein
MSMNQVTKAEDHFGGYASDFMRAVPFDPPERRGSVVGLLGKLKFEKPIDPGTPRKTMGNYSEGVTPDERKQALGKLKGLLSPVGDHPEVAVFLQAIENELSQWGITLEHYASELRLPLDFLLDLGLRDRIEGVNHTVTIPYLDANGNKIATRIVKGTDSVGSCDAEWLNGSSPCLYGLCRIDEALRQRQILIVDNEPDSHILWYHGFPAIAAPGGDLESHLSTLASLDAIGVVAGLRAQNSVGFRNLLAAWS